MNKKGILIVVSGFSGAGKGTLMKELMRKYPRIMLYPSLQQQEVHVTGSRWQRIFLPFQEKFEK